MNKLWVSWQTQYFIQISIRISCWNDFNWPLKSILWPSMDLEVINKINDSLKFLYRKNRYLTRYLKRLLCNALIQPHSDYTCSAWYPNLNKKFKSKLQTVQNKCIRFCLQLNTLNKLTGSRFLKDFISTFVLTLLIFLRKLVLYIFMIDIDNLLKIKQIRDLLFWN